MKTLLLTGCYDIMHIGHIRLIKYAKSISDNIIVAIDSDLKVKKDKGPDRPFNNQEDRKEFLQSICGINEVIIFNSSEELEKICKNIIPDIRLLGSDWKNKKIVGQEYCKEILYFDRISDYSTTKILDKK